MFDLQGPKSVLVMLKSFCYGQGASRVRNGYAFFMGTDDSDKGHTSLMFKKSYFFKFKIISLSYYQGYPRNVTEDGPERTMV